MQRLDRHDSILMARRRRERALKNAPRPWLRAGQTSLAVVLIVLIVFLALIGAGVASVFAVYNTYAAQLTNNGLDIIEKQQEDDFETVRIYDSSGKHLLYESVDPRPFRGDRRFVSKSRMSEWVWKAAVALEDRNFFENPGVNVRGLFRAFASNLGGGAVQGGSSITQQLIKNVIIPPEERAQQSYARKIKEVILALEVTRRFPKDRILEWYLNSNFYGNLAYGVEAASQVYFGKSATQLSLAEAAMLAPIPQFPAQNPINNPDEAKKRQGLALAAMVTGGFITQAEADAAFAEPLQLRKSAAERFEITTAPHFALYVLQRLKDEYNTIEDPYRIWREGFTVYTTLDVDLQNYAQQVARDQISKLIEQKKNASNSSAVVIKNGTGEILAMVGSLDYNNEAIDGQVNIATSERQPGSSFKPYVYATALEKKQLNAASMILDVPMTVPLGDGTFYRPENYDRQYHGPVSLRNALSRSYNIPAIKVMDQVGVADALRLAHRMGINGLNRGLDFYGLNLVLGGGEVTLLDHTYAFSVFGNGGVMIGEPAPPAQLRPGFRTLNPVAIKQIRNSKGDIIKIYEHPEAQRILSAETAYIMADIMSDDVARAPAFGANTDLTLPDRKMGAKTGTTNGFKDNWTMGFTPQFTVGVWVGNTDNTSMDNVTGLSGAAPIFNAVMRRVHENQPVQWYDRPGTVLNKVICQPSGLLVSPNCPGDHQRSEIFAAGTEPTTQDNVWQAVGGTVYEILPQEAADWVRENGIPQPASSSGSDATAIRVGDSDVGINYPGTGGYVNGSIEIKGNARGGPYRLDFGPGEQPDTWTQIGSEHGEEVQDGRLETLDTSGLGEGVYTLRLTVNRPDGPREVRSIFTVDHTPPKVEINEPSENRLYVMEDDEQINVNVDVEDGLRIDRVEFYIDGQRFGTAYGAPFNERWKIKMRDVAQIETGNAQNWLAFPSSDPEIQPGRILFFGDGFAAIRTAGAVYLEEHTLKAIAFDAAGNANTSKEIKVYVRHKKQ
ncbi:MAG: transglycosylase domain-containing protein [Caldilineaceae bacterium]